MALDQQTLDGWVKAYPGLEDLYPATGMQLGLVFHSMLDGGQKAYATQLQMDFEAGFDPELFRRAWAVMLSRHAIFRTAFVGLDRDQPLQVVVNSVRLEWREEDWRALDAEAQEAAFGRHRERDKGLGFDFGRAPLMRMSLMRLSQSRYRWLWTHHHSLLDGWSVAIVMRELLEQYEALLSGRTVTLPRRAAYRDYIAWLCAQDPRAAQAYWRGALSQVMPTRLGLPERRGGADEQDERLLVLPAPRAEALRKAAQRHGVTLNTMVQGAWAYLLHRYGGERNVVFGHTVSGRSTDEVPGIEAMVGLFINTLPAPVEVTGEADVGDWLRGLQQEQAQRESHGHVPLVEIQRSVGLQAGEALFDTLLVFENYPVGESVKEGAGAGRRPRLEVGRLGMHEGTGYGLTLVVVPARELSFKLLYQPARYDRETIAALLGHLAVILEGLADPSPRQVRDLPYLRPSDYEELVERRNATAHAYPHDRCIHELFEDQVRRRPDAIALVHEGGQLTYAELNRRANRLAHRLIGRGVGPEVRVGLCTAGSADRVIGLLGISKAGGCLVPLDPAHPVLRSSFVIEDAAVELVVCDRPVAQSPDLASLAAGDASTEWLSLDSPCMAAAATADPRTAVVPDHAAQALHAPDDTGELRAVVGTHRGVVNLATFQSRRCGVNVDSRVLQVAAPGRDVATPDWCMALLAGGTLHVAAKETVRAAAALRAYVERHGIDRLIHTTADGVDVTVDEARACAAAGQHSEGRRSYRTYAAAESGGVSILGESDAAHVAGIGRPIDNATAYVLGPEGELCPPAVAGELHLGGVGLARGYLNRPGRTAATFIPHRFSRNRGERLYRTGELARWLPDGTLELLGRVDSVVKVRGFRVELTEIERVLAAHAGVREAAVVARDDAGSRRLVSYVVAAEGADPRELVAELRRALQQQLPGYRMPADFMVLARLPRTADGKLDREALPSPDAASDAQYAPPEGLTEELLAQLWCTVLERARVGRHDSFFALGGHSLLATQLVSRIRRIFSAELPLRELFEHPTLAAQARAIERAQGAGALVDTAVTPVSRDEPLPLSYAQQRLWFLHQYAGPSAVYNMPLALRLDGEVDEAALVRSLEELYRRHESLRTRFESRQGGAVQVIDAPRLELAVETVSAAETHALAHAERTHRFDLARERLCRIRLLRERRDTGDHGDYVLLVTMHHSVSDGWSLGIFLRELVSLYRAFASGERSPLAPLPIQYADYAQWQRRWLQGEVLERQLAYWREQLTGLPPLLTLPTDRPRPVEQTFRGSTRQFALPAPLGEKLQALSREQGVTLYMTLLSAFAVLLGKYAGQQDVAIGTPIANRTRRETEGLIGFFVNTLVMRHDLRGDPRFVELLQRTRQMALQAYAHQDVPFEQLVEQLNPERSLSHSPLFQVMFILQNVPLDAVELPGLAVRPLGSGAAPAAAAAPAREGTARFDLTLSLHESPAGLVGDLEYNTDLFDAATIARMLAHYTRLLEAVAATPRSRLSRLEMLGSDERRRQLLEWNATARAFPAEACIHGLFEEQARRRPDAIALVQDGRELTYAELNRRANALAHELIGRGVGPEVRVGLCMRRSIEMVIGMLGILKAGGCYVPLDPEHPRRRIDYLLEDARIGLVVSEPAVAAQVAGQGRELLLLDAAQPPRAPERAYRDVDREARGLRAAHPAYLIYTSASTGAPKGVLGLHRSIVNRVSWLAGSLGVAGDEVLCQKTSLGFVDHVAEIFQALCAGVPLVILPTALLHAPRALLRELDARRVTQLTLVPSLLKSVLDAGRGERARWLRSIYSSGEALNVAGLQPLAECFPRARLFNIYGSTEMGADVTCQHVAAQSLAARGAGWAPIGRGIDNTQAYVLDCDGQLAVAGAVGELHVGGVCLARGYFRRAGLTAESFVPDAFSREPGARVYRTGDLARWRPDGTLEYLGRADTQVKVRGFRIELAEIERALLAHDAVRDAVVVAREHAGDRRLVGYVVTSAAAPPGHAALVDGVRAWLQQQLPAYMVPSAFVVLESLPLTATGKVDRNALPAPQAPPSAAQYAAPEGPAEELLAQLWGALLARERVGRQDHFFELGGHSLLATQLVSRVREAFSIDFPVRQVFEHPTLAAQARALERARGAGAPAEVAMEVVSREQPLPLSYAQQRLWFLHQYIGPNAVYNIPLVLRLQGEVNEAALVRSLQELHRRHETLRTRFESRDGSVLQVIDAPGLDLAVETVSAPEAQAIAYWERSYHFDLSRERLCRIRLLRETRGERSDAGDYLLLVTMHHSVSDGWSLGVFFHELVRLYQAFTSGERSPLAPLAVQYADYAQWQRRWLQGEVLERQVSYWREQLRGLPPLLTLPTDRPRPGEQTYRGSMETIAMPASLSAQIEALSREQRVTSFMTLLSAWALLLGRYAGQRDVAVGTPIANRTRRETEGLIGFFANTLVMRHDLRGDPRFVELLARTRETALQAYAHQDVPFEQLVEQLNPERSLSHSPLFQVMFTLQNAPLGTLELPGLAVHAPRVEHADENAEPEGTARFDLTLGMQETPAGLVGVLEYNTDLFERGTIRRMLHHYLRLLEAVVRSPEARSSQLDMLSAQERRQQLIDWNATAQAYPQQLCIHELIEEQARRTPERIALVLDAQSLTYAELDARANQVAHFLMERGAGPGTRVALCLERSLEMVIGLVGILKAGAAYVPLEPGYPLQRLSYMMANSTPVAVLTHGAVPAAVREHLASVAGPAPVIDLLAHAAPWEASSREQPRPRLLALTPAHVAYVIYTSGSTGQPKGVMVAHRGLVNRLWWMQRAYGLTERDAVLQKTPFSFDVSVWEFLWPLMTGAKLVMARPEGHKDPDYLVNAVRTQHISVMHFVPSMMPAFLDVAGVGDCATLAHVFSSGEALPGALARRFRARLPHVDLQNLYGPTEATVDVTAWACVDPGEDSVPIGRPISNTQMYVLDDSLQLLPSKVPGELYIGGVGLAVGYLDRPDLTAERFVPSPYSSASGERLYRTGDVARWLADGSLEYLGRVDHQVKIRGFRIELGEIEAVLMQHPSLQDARVLVRDYGEQDRRLVAYLVPSRRTAAPVLEELRVRRGARPEGMPAREPDAGEAAAARWADERSLLEDLRAFLKERLPEYMVPAAHVLLHELPLTSNGKLDRRALPAPDVSGPESQYQPPEGMTERLLAGLWSELLKRERVGRQDHFFDLGGHSLLAMQLVSRIRQTFSTELAVRELFEHPTLCAQAGAVERARSAGARADLPLARVSRDQPLALSSAQQRLWFLHEYMGPSAVYNVPLAVRLRGDVDEAALVRSLDELHERHETLRTRFEPRDGEAVQVIGPPGLGLGVETVTAAESQQIVHAERSHCFDLAREPLCRVRLLRETGSERGEEGDYVLLVTMHHSVSDAWSLGIFLRELVSLYRAHASGERPPLAPLPIQYADYAQWQRRWLQGELLDSQVAYWRTQLTGLPPLLTLPTDRPRPAEQTFRGRTEPFALPVALTARLQALSREQGVTLFMTLLAGWAVLLGRYSGQQQVAIGTPVANRTRRETEGLIGFFVNMLVMREDLRGDPRFVDLLRQTREVALQAYAHQDVPFEQLVDALNPGRHLGHSPLFQVAFGLVNTPFDAVELPGVAVLPLVEDAAAQPEGTARFDMTLNVQEVPSGLVGGLEYNTDLFDRATIRRMLDHYTRLLEAAVAAPEAPVSQLEMLTDSQRRQQLIEWNTTARPFPQGRCIHEWLETHAARNPDAVAIGDEARQITYRQLDARANGLANRLIGQGVTRGSVVGLCVEGDAERMIGLLGILKTGGACVPLNPDAPAEQLEYLLEDSGVELIVAQSAVRSRVQRRGEQAAARERRWVELHDDGDLAAGRDASPGAAADVADLACILYEPDPAGGAPLGRLMPHAGMLAQALVRERQSSEEWTDALLTRLRSSAAAASGGKIPVAASGATHYVLDRHGALLPVGAVGELCVGGEAAGWGYLHRADLTAERWVPDAFSAVPGARLYRTGTRSRWRADGTLEHVGAEAAPARTAEDERLEIERALLGHEDVRDAVVVMLEAPAQPRWAAYVVARDHGAMPAQRFIAGLQAYLRAQPKLGRLPDEWTVLTALPRTAAGVVDRAQLPRAVGTVLPYAAPRTPLERVLVEVWQEQLGIERVGVEDNYFALGGDSIRSILLVAQARKRGVDFSIKDLFAHPTVAGLAAAIERGEVRGADAVQHIAPFALLSDAERERLDLRHDRAAVEDAYPLSTMQQGMVMESLRHADLKVYQNGHCYHFEDAWDPERFEQALRRLMARHPMLRTVYDFSGERPLQLVLAQKAPELTVLDIRHLDGPQVQAALDRWVQQERAQPFDVSASLWRLTIHVLSDRSFIFGMYIHHAQWDGWSLESFATELYATYGLLRSEGRAVDHAPPPTYAQFVALEQAAVASETQRAYWARKLEGATVPWWTGRRKSASAYLPCDVSQETSLRLAELAQSLGVQEKSVWCSVYLALLSMLNGSDEAVGTLITQGRPEIPGGDRMVGVFLNALPIRMGMSGRRWRELITATDRELREQHAFRRYPLAEIQRVTGLDCSATTFHYSNWHVYYEGVEREGTREEWLPQKVGGWQETNYLLTLYVHKDDRSRRYHVDIGADSEVFDAAFRERIRGYALRIIAAIAADAAAVIDKSRLLSDAERQRQLVEWNATERATRDDGCIHERFEAHARAHPTDLAVTDGERSLTYAELDARANRLSRYLVAQGVGPEVSVGICTGRSVEMVVGLLGVLKAGGCYVPLDPEYPAERIAYILATSACALVLCDPDLLEDVAALSSVKTFPLGGDLHDALVGRHASTATAADIRPSPCNSAYVIFTSGSTGKPKGVRISHASLGNYLCYAAEAYFAQRAGAVVSTSLSFDATVTSLLVPLVAGRFTYLLRQDDEFGRLKRILSAPDRDLVFKLTPAHMEMLEPLIDAAADNAHLLVIGGEQLTRRRVCQWQRAVLPRAVYVNEYGPTETVVGCSTYWVAGPLWSADDSGAVPIGRPICNTALYAVDGDLEPVPVGVPGELLIGGAGVAQGYVSQPAQTAARFIPNPFGGAPGERLYRTGDIVRWLESGDLEYLGRTDTQIKIRGFRIELGEIEGVMLRHARVRDAVAVGRKDGSGNDRIVVYVVEDRKPGGNDAAFAEEGQDLELAATNSLANELRAHAQQLLPAYMQPAAIMVMDVLPITSNGKRNLEALPTPDFARFQSQFVAPRDDVERALCNCWRGLLKVENIGIHDDFWALGGQSLLAMRVCNFVRQEFGVELKLSKMFSNPSVAQLALHISLELDVKNMSSKQLVCEVAEDIEEGGF